LSSQAQAPSDLGDIYSSYVERRYSAITIRRLVNALEVEKDRLEVWRHPLGFAHAELTPFVGAPVGERFRLHFWLDDNGVSDALGDLHEHTWHLTSLVLAGEVIDSNLVATPSLVGEYLGSRIEYGPNNIAHKVGRFSLHVSEVRKIKKGAIYQIPSRTVHLNKVGMIPTVTLVRSIEDRRGDGPLVLSRGDAGQGFATGRRELIPTAHALHALSKACSGVMD